MRHRLVDVLRLVALALICAGVICRAQSACAACHPAAAKTYQQTGMARSFYRPSVGNMNEGQYYHAPSDINYELLQRGGHYFQRQYQKGSDGKRRYGHDEPSNNTTRVPEHGVPPHCSFYRAANVTDHCVLLRTETACQANSVAHSGPNSVRAAMDSSVDFHEQGTHDGRFFHEHAPNRRAMSPVATSPA